MRPFVIHAHFYQPERLNPWTGALDPEPSAAPSRDWNERVLRECYRPNGAARIFDDDGRIRTIVNNYERLSFNYGPTLLSWMERAHPDTYERVLAGRDNAIAQAYNHMILPLATPRDRRTQIHWGLADFRYRFGRDAAGLWLPETAVDRATIDALIDAGVGFTVLAPHQIARVSHPGGLDVGRPYRHLHSDGSGRGIAVFVYDGGLAQSLAFDPSLGDTEPMLDRIAAAGAAHDGLIHAALDGETFGHHHHFRELGLAHALFGAAEARGLRPTSYAAYLAEHPPTDELEVVAGEGTAWSCVHGVGRWYRDCGCTTDSQPGWNQRWRTPLRQALDVVRGAAAAAFEERGGALVRDPWRARDDAIGLRLGTQSWADFLRRHARAPLTDAEQVDLRTLLEAQRNAMVMYTSCGWFFSDVSGIETRYVMRSAHRVLGLLEEIGHVAPWDDVLGLLGEARSNKPEAGSGADVWRQHIEPAAVGPQRVAAHLAVVGLIRGLDPEGETAGHAVVVRSHRRQQRGRTALSTAALTITSLATGRRSELTVAAVHLGGLDVHGSASRYRSDEEFRRADRRLWQAFPSVPLPQMLRLVSDLLPGGEFGFEQLLPDGVQEVVGAIFSDLRTRFREQYTRLYHDHQRILEMLVAAGYTLPRELRAAAELTLAGELDRLVAHAAADPAAFEWIHATVELARTQGYELDLAPVADAVTASLLDATRKAAASLAGADVVTVEGWITFAADLGVHPDLSQAQELAFEVRGRGSAAARLGQALGLADSPAAGPRS